VPYTNDPANIPSDRVRFLVGDTNLSSPDLSDQEVDFLLEDEGNDARRAAARAAEALAARYTREAEEKTVGPLRLRSLTDKSKKYTALARTLWARVTKTAAVPFAGGISATDKAMRADEGDRVHPMFAKDMMTYPLGEATHVATTEDTAL
jgi:hypothetical protein